MGCSPDQARRFRKKSAVIPLAFLRRVYNVRRSHYYRTSGYDVLSVFMKELKQRFSKYYNKQTGARKMPRLPFDSLRTCRSLRV